MAEEIKLILSADDEGLQASFARARAAVGTYEKRIDQSRQAALRSALGQEEVLKLQAAGHTKQAAALEQEIRLHEEARKLAERAGITEQKAITLLERRAALQRQIAASQGQMPKATPGGRPGLPMADMNISPQTMQAMERTAFLQENLRRQMLATGRSGNMGAMGFLAFSQAVEDAQYGIRGVLNNIPQMVMGFGGSMGVAGAISLAAVAATALYPVLKRLYGAAETERLQKAADAWGTAFKEGMERARGFREETELAGYLAQYSEQAAQAMRDRLNLQDSMIPVIEREVEARERARALVDEIASAEKRLAQARGGASNSGNEARRAELLKRMAEDAGTQQVLLDRASAEAARLNQAAANLRAESAEDVAAKNQEILRLKENLAGAEANAAAAQAELDGGAKLHDKGNAQRNLAFANEAKKNLEATIAILEGERSALLALQESSDAGVKEQLRQLDEKINGHFQEAKAIAEKRKQLQRLQEIERELEKTERDKAKAAALMKGSDRGMEIARQAMEQSVKDAEEKARITRARVGIAGEMQALRLEASGRKEQADALRTELELRASAVDVAKELGVTEQTALQILREKERLTREIANQSERQQRNEARSGIRRASADKLQAGGGRIESRGAGAFLRTDLTRAGGLRNSALEDRNKERAALARPADRAASFYEKQLNLTEEMLKTFQKLGAY